MIVVVGGIKGGSGKTTIATNLVVLRAASGRKVLLVDADPQRSSSKWALQRENAGVETTWTTIQLDGAIVRSQILKLVPDYDDVIVDVGGRDTNSQRYSLMVADVAIFPFQPRSLDVWTLPELKELINDITTANEKLKAYAIVNRGDVNGVDNDSTMEIIKDCPSLICLPCVIGNRKAFANAASEGLGVSEMKPCDKKAVLEVFALYNNVYNQDNIQENTHETRKEQLKTLALNMC